MLGDMVQFLKFDSKWKVIEYNMHTSNLQLLASTLKLMVLLITLVCIKHGQSRQTIEHRVNFLLLV